MSEAVLGQIEAIIQRDVNRRGLARDPRENLVTACAGDFAAACRTLARVPNRADATVLILTGFYILSAKTYETDGPFAAVFLARVLVKLGFRALLVSDAAACDSLALALREAGLEGAFAVRSVTDLPAGIADRITHVISIERAGPSHTAQSLHRQHRQGPVPEPEFLAAVPVEHWDHYHTMRGDIITDQMEPGHVLVEKLKANRGQALVTIGIGDGGNEIGMGKIPWEVIARNVKNGALVACRVPADYNIVCGVSNWGAYGLAAGAWHLAGRPFAPELFDPVFEHDLWTKVLAECVLVDGMTGKRTLTVDGLFWEDYIAPLEEIGRLLASGGV